MNCTSKTVLPYVLVSLTFVMYLIVSRRHQFLSNYTNPQPAAYKAKEKFGAKAETETVRKPRTKASIVGYTVQSPPIQEERAVILKQKCSTLQHKTVEENFYRLKRYNIIVNDKHRLLFCLVPKVASTTLRRIMLTLDDTVDIEEALAIRNIHEFAPRHLYAFWNLSLEEMKYRIENYTKVVIVREPMERMLSAYRSQFEDHKVKLVNEKYKTHFKDIPTFGEFVSHLLQLIKEGGEGPRLAVHWWTATSLCQPCTMNYDIVVKFETIEEDMRYIFKHLHVENDVIFPTRSDVGYKKNKTATGTVKYYQQVPESDINAIKHFYSQDYTLFGYTAPAINGTKISTVQPFPIQEERATMLKDKCNALQNVSKNDVFSNMKRRGNIIVNDKHKLVFCLLPKAASLTMRRILLTFEGKVAIEQALELKNVREFVGRYLHSFRDLSLEEIKYRIEKYTKVLIVREPMERLLSAYRCQFEDHDVTYVNTNYKTNFTKVPSFRKFVKYLLQKVKDEGEGYGLDLHWWTATSMCSPCAIKYDIVAKFETLEDDMKYIFTQLHVENEVTFPNRSDVGYKKNETNRIMNEYFQQLSESNINAIKQFYSKDYFLFGYTAPVIHSTTDL